jgi:hypothetical protein
MENAEERSFGFGHESPPCGATGVAMIARDGPLWSPLRL